LGYFENEGDFKCNSSAWNLCAATDGLKNRYRGPIDSVVKVQESLWHEIFHEMFKKFHDVFRQER